MSAAIHSTTENKEESKAPIQDALQTSAGTAEVKKDPIVCSAGVAGTQVNEHERKCVAPDNWHLPEDNKALFVGREHLIAALNSRSTDMKTDQPVVLSTILGLNGVGKTSLAIHYLHHAKPMYRFRVWFQAKNLITLQADYLTFAQHFHLIPSRGEISTEEVCAKVVAYLEQQPSWLAVYDNAEDYHILKSYLPIQKIGQKSGQNSSQKSGRGNGHVLITTLQNEWQEIGKPIEVALFTETEALTYLQKAVGDRILSERSDALTLIGVLGALPLALVQAGAYIKRQGISVANYLARYREHISSLPMVKRTSPASQDELVAITLSISLAAIAEEEKHANAFACTLAILESMTHLKSEAIPRNLLLEAYANEMGLAFSPSIAQTVIDQAIHRLQAYALVHLQLESNTLHIHRLVHFIVRSKALERQESTARWQPQLAWARCLIQQLTYEHPDLTAVNRINSLIPYAWAITESLRTQDLYPEITPMRIQLLSRIGYHQNKGVGNYSLALKANKTALTLAEAFYPPNFAELETYFDNLSSTYAALGETHLALSLSVFALEIVEQHYPENHPKITIQFSKLGSHYYALGKYQQALSRYEQALAIAEENHPIADSKLIVHLNNVALSHYALKDYSQALFFFEDALEIAEENYPFDHAEVESCLINLSMVYSAMGRNEKALPLQKRILAIAEKNYPTDYLEIAARLGDLGLTQYALGDYQSALALQEHALAIVEKHYGSTHGKLGVCLMDIAMTHHVLGNKALANTELTQAYRIFYTKDGSKHPNTKEVAAQLKKWGLPIPQMLSSPPIAGPGKTASSAFFMPIAPSATKTSPGVIFIPAKRPFSSPLKLHHETVLEHDSNYMLAEEKEQHTSTEQEIDVKIIEESYQLALDQGNVGPRIIPGWGLKDAEAEGNCFYLAVTDQLRSIRHSFLQNIPPWIEAHDCLRLHIQGDHFKDKAWADYKEILQLVKTLNVVVAIVDTRYPQRGYVYHYCKRGGGIDMTPNRTVLPLDVPVINIAFTGDHYLSVVNDRSVVSLSSSSAPLSALSNPSCDPSFTSLSSSSAPLSPLRNPSCNPSLVSLSSSSAQATHGPFASDTTPALLVPPSFISPVVPVAGESVDIPAAIEAKYSVIPVATAFTLPKRKREEDPQGSAPAGSFKKSKA